MTRFVARVDAKGRTGQVLVDGWDIARAIHGFRVEAEAGHLTRIDLEMHVFETTTLEFEHAELHIGQDVADALVRLGWTPPAHQTVEEAS